MSDEKRLTFAQIVPHLSYKAVSAMMEVIDISKAFTLWRKLASKESNVPVEAKRVIHQMTNMAHEVYRLQEIIYSFVEECGVEGAERVLSQHHWHAGRVADENLLKLKEWNEKWPVGSTCIWKGVRTYTTMRAVMTRGGALVTRTPRSKMVSVNDLKMLNPRKEGENGEDAAVPTRRKRRTGKQVPRYRDRPKKAEG